MADIDQTPTHFDTSVDEYLVRTYDGNRQRKLLENSGWDPAFSAELGELGWYGLAVPEGFGGLGAPLSELGQVFVQFGRHLVVGPLIENLLLPAVLRRFTGVGSHPAIAEAIETGVPLAIVDTGVTDDWTIDIGSIALRDGHLSGTVSAVRFAQHASLLVVVANTGTGLALCLVDPTARGVRIEALDSDDPATQFARVNFDNVRGGAVVECGPAAEDLVSRIRSWSRLLIACELSGITQHSLQCTIEHVSVREQFGQSVGSFQAVKHIAADMHARTSGLRNLCLAALTIADDSSVADLNILAATAKAHASDSAVRVCEDAIQLHGGMGFTTETDVSWYYRRALALRGWYGDASELELRIGTALLAFEPSDTSDVDPAENRSHA